MSPEHERVLREGDEGERAEVGGDREEEEDDQDPGHRLAHVPAGHGVGGAVEARLG